MIFCNKSELICMQKQNKPYFLSEIFFNYFLHWDRTVLPFDERKKIFIYESHLGMHFEDCIQVIKTY